MNITATFTNRTTQQVLEVVTDRSGIWFEAAQVLSIPDREMGRDGNRLNRKQTENLLNYWQSAGHNLQER